MHKPLIPLRKPGKLPYTTRSYRYDLEYGSARSSTSTPTPSPSRKVLLVDDVLATGGTMAAACRLIEQVGGKVAAAPSSSNWASSTAAPRWPARTASVSFATSRLRPILRSSCPADSTSATIPRPTGPLGRHAARPSPGGPLDRAGAASFCNALVGLIQFNALPGQIDDMIAQVEADPNMTREEKDNWNDILTTLKDMMTQPTAVIAYVVNMVLSGIVAAGGVQLLAPVRPGPAYNECGTGHDTLLHGVLLPVWVPGRDLGPGRPVPTRRPHHHGEASYIPRGQESRPFLGGRRRHDAQSRIYLKGEWMYSYTFIIVYINILF